MATAVIVDAIRTPLGALGGARASVRPDDLAALVIKEIVARNKLDPALVEEVIFGCANQAGEGMQRPDRGEVCRVDGREIASRDEEDLLECRKKVGMLFQPGPCSTP